MDLTRFVNLRTSMAAVVVGVAGVAAVQSFSHIYWLAATHGQSPLDSVLMPLGVDGLILAMTLVLLHEARRDQSGPPLANLMLWLGILATVGANVLFGIRYGVVGSIVSAWPAAAFIGTVHVVTGVAKAWSAAGPVRSSPEVTEDEVPAADPVGQARAALAASVAAGNPLSERKLARQFGISRPRAKQIRTTLETEGLAA